MTTLPLKFELMLMLKFVLRLTFAATLLLPRNPFVLAKLLVPVRPLVPAKLLFVDILSVGVMLACGVVAPVCPGGGRRSTPVWVVVPGRTVTVGLRVGEMPVRGATTAAPPA